MLEVRVLKYFVAIVREGNISRAADRLHVTQPTLSRQIMQLEEELGVRLFDRSGHRLSLTEEGLHLYRRAQEIIELSEKTRQELAQKETELAGTISIGCGEAENVLVLMKLMTAFRQEHPLVAFNVYTAVADDVKERLESGLVDIGLLIEPVEVSRYLYIRMPLQEHWRALVRRDSSLAKKTCITPRDLVGVPLILSGREMVRGELDSWFGNLSDQMVLAASLNLSHCNQMMMVESGLGVVMTVDFPLTSDQLMLKPLSPDIINGCLLVWKKDRRQSRLVAEFIRYAREQLSGGTSPA